MEIISDVLENKIMIQRVLWKKGRINFGFGESENKKVSDRLPDVRRNMCEKQVYIWPNIPILRSPASTQNLKISHPETQLELSLLIFSHKVISHPKGEVMRQFLLSPATKERVCGTVEGKNRFRDQTSQSETLTNCENLAKSPHPLEP